MTTHESSTGPRRDGSARDAVEIAATDAVEALAESLAQYEVNDDDTIALAYTGLTLGHLRAILAALSAPYVPGMQVVDKDVWNDIADGPAAVVTVWGADIYTQGASTYFAPQVSR